MEREKERERIKTTCEYEREKCQKVVTKWLYIYHFSFFNQVMQNRYLLELGESNMKI
jgi:hypothetical protein